MKKPENFNAGATRKETQSKVDPITEAINGNFQRETVIEQRNSSSSENQPETVQIQNTVQTQVTQNQQAVPPVQAAVKEKKESFLVSMSQGERSLYKSLCALQNVSMNHFVICAMDYFKEELENGKISISKHGYKRM